MVSTHETQYGIWTKNTILQKRQFLEISEILKIGKIKSNIKINLIFVFSAKLLLILAHLSINFAHRQILMLIFFKISKLHFFLNQNY
jgi:hypothetical protein